ncbi:Alkaline phosphatase [Taenia solium]|eukprot:TsM_000911600 transcript=TsM_000911600 gene=TsM_000911600
MVAIRAFVLIVFFVASLTVQSDGTATSQTATTPMTSSATTAATTATTTVTTTITTPGTTTQQPIVQNEKAPDYWYNLAKERFERDCKVFPSLKNAKRAKNVILLLGDGMGMPTISAGRFYAAQEIGLNGSIKKHPFEEWPYNTMARTYDLETSVTDSASSATAYLTGTKTRTGIIGLTGDIGVKQCGTWPKWHYSESVLEAAYRAGKATGVLTNTRITHASPSGCYGHVSYRDMESDADIMRFCPNDYQTMVCQDLACQLINDHPYINVMIGGGQKNFYPNTTALPANKSEKGVRLDGRSLVTEWENNQTSKNHKYCLVQKPSDLALCDGSNVDYLLALPYSDHMPYNHLIDWGEPNLLGYVRKAIEVLEHQPNGYFLFIESGRIDHAHHNNEGRRSLDEMKHFDEIIAYIENTVNLEETLVIVTADHSHAFELVGQPGRFQSAIGLDQYYSNNTNDHMPLQGLNYMNGPNGLVNESRKNPGVLDIYSWTYRQQTLVPLSFASHGGDDVGVYAIGPMSPIFHVTVDNTMIAQAMKFALGAEPFNKKATPCG